MNVLSIYTQEDRHGAGVERNYKIQPEHRAKFVSFSSGDGKMAVCMRKGGARGGAISVNFRTIATIEGSGGTRRKNKKFEDLNFATKILEKIC